MMSLWSRVLLCALACAPLPCWSAPADSPPSSAASEIAALRAELNALKSEYADRISALEARISKLEAGAPGGEQPRAVAQAPAAGAPSAVAADAAAAAAAAGFGAASAADGQSAAAPPAGVAGNSSNAFNPAISLILVGNYAHLSSNPDTYRIAGFVPPNDGDVGPGQRSFNLGETELTVAANVDPYFFANATVALTADNQVSVEEAYFKTLALPSGFSLKAGRFFSGLGYLNEIHSHAWDFIDQPLVYQVFFGSQLTQDGAQLKWLAPTDTFIELGAEAGNGRKFPGTSRDSNALSGTALFAHVGGDWGDSTSWRTGVSFIEHRAENRSYGDTDVFGAVTTDAFSGTSRTWIADAILKWAPHGDVTRNQLKLQGEYMHRTESGQLAFETALASLSDIYRSNQSGWYVQAVYQFVPRWRIGLRYDSLSSGTPRIGLVSSGLLPAGDFPALLSASPDRTSVMFDWSLSEFSRIRAQYAWDDARLNQRDHELFLQYIFAIGAHGAHKF
jgi:hypothetical protein